jgi:uncharacterized protein
MVTYAMNLLDLCDIFYAATGREIPIVSVTHPQAKVTHEAAIGSVDKHQLETLMAHGLAPDEAVDVIVKGMLT